MKTYTPTEIPSGKIFVPWFPHLATRSNETYREICICPEDVVTYGFHPMCQIHGY